MNIVTRKAHRQATAPASIAVNTPPRMPPRMMTSVINPQIASMVIFTASRAGTGLPCGWPLREAKAREEDNTGEAEQQARHAARHEQADDRDRAAGRERIDYG